MLKRILFVSVILVSGKVYADTKLSALTADTTGLATDLLYKVDSPGGTPVSRFITIGNFVTQVAVSSLTQTAVSPGSYTNTNLTVGADGRLTAASNGSGSGGTIGGSDKQIQFNQGGAFQGSSKLTYNTTSNILTSGATNQFTNSVIIGTSTTLPLSTMLSNQLTVNVPSLVTAQAAAVIASTNTSQVPLILNQVSGANSAAFDIYQGGGGFPIFEVNGSGNIDILGSNFAGIGPNAFTMNSGGGTAIFQNANAAPNSNLSIQSGSGAGSIVELTAGPTAGTVFQATVAVNGVFISSLTVQSGIIDANIGSGQCIQTGSGGLLTGTGSACGSGGGGVSVYPATSTVTGIFSAVFDASQAKLPGSGSPYISNSTNEFSASVYYDDTSTQSATWSTDVFGYGGKALFADILFTSTNTSNYLCWGVYTATNTPNVSTNNYDSTTFNVDVTTAVTANSNQLALSVATVALTNTTISNGQILTVKVERETGGCGNTESVGFGRVKKVRIHE